MKSWKGEGGTLNTDNRLYLEFSAPFSIATPAVMAADIDAIAAHRESILPYLKPAPDEGARETQRLWSAQQLEAGKLGDRALAGFLRAGPGDPQTTLALRRLTMEYPRYAPGRALWAEHEAALALQPRLLGRAQLQCLTEDVRASVIEVAAVLALGAVLALTLNGYWVFVLANVALLAIVGVGLNYAAYEAEFGALRRDLPDVLEWRDEDVADLEHLARQRPDLLVRRVLLQVPADYL